MSTPDEAKQNVNRHHARIQFRSIEFQLNDVLVK